MKTILVSFRLPDDINTALKTAAKANFRSIASQGSYYLMRGLMGDGFYRAGVGPVDPAVAAKPVAVAPVVRVTDASPNEVQPTPSARVLQEIVFEAGFKSHAVATFGKLARAHFPDILSLADARNLGPDAWLEVNAPPAIMKGLYPGMPDLAKTAQMLCQRVRESKRNRRQPKRISA